MGIDVLAAVLEVLTTVVDEAGVVAVLLADCVETILPDDIEVMLGVAGRFEGWFFSGSVSRMVHAEPSPPPQTSLVKPGHGWLHWSSPTSALAGGRSWTHVHFVPDRAVYLCDDTLHTDWHEPYELKSYVL